MEQNIEQFIKTVLNYYDNTKQKYFNLINSEDFKFDKNFDRDTTITIYSTDDKKKHIFDYELLGLFDVTTKIWVWGWTMSDLNKNLISSCTYLLNYGIDIDTTDTKEHFFIKSLLVNSRILLEEDISLDINIAICSYILKNKCKFILPRKIYINNDKNNYYIHYYLIK